MSNWETGFANRAEAGRALAARIASERLNGSIVLGIPRGGAVVGSEIARSLDPPFDLLLIERIGAPGAPEACVGAVVDGHEPHTVVYEEIALAHALPPGYLEDTRQKKLAETARRRMMYRGSDPDVDLRGRHVIVADDGIVHGATIRAALEGLRRAGAVRIDLAVPVASRRALSLFDAEVERLFCLAAVAQVRRLASEYASFEPVTDEAGGAALPEGQRRAGRRMKAGNGGFAPVPQSRAVAG